jgi:hypothetical protein
MSRYEYLPPTLQATLGIQAIGQNLLTQVDSYPYLGVNISSDLRWSAHVEIICAKATRTLNLISRNIYRCSAESKSLAFTVLVRPHLKFAAGACEPNSAKDCSKLVMVQRQAARFVKRDYRRTTSASSILAGLGWTQLSESRKQSRLVKSSHALQSNPQPGCHSHRWPSPAIKIHQTLRPINFHQHTCQHQCIQVFFLSQNNNWLEQASGHDKANTIVWIFPISCSAHMLL